MRPTERLTALLSSLNEAISSGTLDEWRAEMESVIEAVRHLEDEVGPVIETRNAREMIRLMHDYDNAD
jgi:hypothetical protein